MFDVSGSCWTFSSELSLEEFEKFPWKSPELGLFHLESLVSETKWVDCVEFKVKILRFESFLEDKCARKVEMQTFSISSNIGWLNKTALDVLGKVFRSRAFYLLSLAGILIKLNQSQNWLSIWFLGKCRCGVRVLRYFGSFVGRKVISHEILWNFPCHLKIWKLASRSFAKWLH